MRKVDGRVISTRKQKSDPPAQQCAAEGCTKMFVPYHHSKGRFCSKECKNREGQRMLRARARMGLRDQR